MFRTALRNVLAHKARLLMTVLAVLLGVAFVSGTLVFTDTVSDAYTKSAEKSFTGIDVRMRPAKNAGGHDTGRLLDQELLDRAGRLARREGRGGRRLRLRRAGRQGRSDWSARAGPRPAPTTTARTATAIPIREGVPPSGKGEIAIDARTAERTGYSVGDTVRLSVSGPVLRQRGHRDLHHRRRQRRRRRHAHPLRHRHRPAALRRARPLQPDRSDRRPGHHVRAAEAAGCEAPAARRPGSHRRRTRR